MGSNLEIGADGQESKLGKGTLVAAAHVLSDDMRELLDLFRELAVEYAIVGGFAFNYYGYVRTTQDIDILVNPTIENAARVVEAFARFGFAGAGIPRELLEREGGIVHLGVEPNRNRYPHWSERGRQQRHFRRSSSC